MAFKIGDETIDRNMMPSQIAWQQANPEYHLAQTVQDIFAAKLGGGMMMPQSSQQDMGMQQTADTQASNQWNGGNQ